MNLEEKLAEASRRTQAAASSPQPRAPKTAPAAQSVVQDAPHRVAESANQPEPAPWPQVESQPAGTPVEKSSAAVRFAGDVAVAGGAKDLAEDGWLGWLNRVLPFLNISRTEAELERDGWLRDMNAVVHPTKVIGVVSPNGSTGKSSNTQLIGTTLSKSRAGKGVCAIDIDASSILATRMRPVTAQLNRESVDTFVDAIRRHEVNAQTTVDSFMVTNKQGFNVLPGVSYTGGDPLSADRLHDALTTLYDYQKLILLDFPGSREVPVAEEALGWLDAMVFVVETNATSLNSANHMLEQISRSHPDLLERTIILLNNRSGGAVLPDLEAARGRLGSLIHAGEGEGRIFRIDNDSHVYESGPLELEKCEEDTQRRFEEVSAALMRVLPLRGEPKFLGAHR
ncbi:hypothetical protein [Corynebacterium sp. AOP12-C2-36]|uniref:hypothetical protein n=1 Tax=Corynebacterium sp. AOP12-C2-36 TaxID=3457723 RepID=UPI004034272F